MKTSSSHQHSRVYELQAELCKALSHPLRLKILDLLEADTAVANSDLVESLDIPKANLSQHIGVLHKAGIITVEKSGIRNSIRLSAPQVKEACVIVKKALLESLEAQMGELSQVQSSLKSH